MAEHLNILDERPSPLPGSTAVPQLDETEEILKAGRRALQHVWESKLWTMIQTDNRPADDVEAAYAQYQKALGIFDAGPNTDDSERQWLSPEFAASLDMA